MFIHAGVMLANLMCKFFSNKPMKRKSFIALQWLKCIIDPV